MFRVDLEGSGPVEDDRQAVGFFVEEVLVGLLAVFGLVGSEDAIYTDASFPKPAEGAGEVFEDAGGAKVFGLAGEFPFPAASDDGVIVEDGGVQIVEGEIGEFVPGGGNADDFAPFANGMGGI